MGSRPPLGPGAPTAAPASDLEAEGRSCAEAIGLLQLGDSLFPTGAFTFSQGLEAFVHDGLVEDGARLGGFLTDLLEQWAWIDGIALLRAHDAARRGDPAGLEAADREVLCRKLAREAREMSLRLGASLWRASRTLWPGALETADALVREGRLAPSHPVALGVAAGAAGLERRAAFTLGAYGALSGACGAALRLVRVDHLQVQGLLRDAARRCGALYRECGERPLAAMRGFSPALEVEAMRHQRARVRLFAG